VIFVDATTAAGGEKTLHDARRTFATRLRLAGLDRDQIADIMCWKRTALTGS
jgi:integrase